MRYLLSMLLLAACGSTFAADLAKIDRTIVKEPKYIGQPRYCLLVFGPEATNRVWIVQDGGVLYVDRNGNGDLTGPDKKVIAKKSPSGDDEPGFAFEVGDLKVGGKTHKGLEVSLFPVKEFASNPNMMSLPSMAATVRKHPNELTGRIGIDVECTS